jgi:starvation-inducible DNA-binding protein
MDNMALAEFLKTLLASTVSLSIKAQNYHWNVSGINFGDHHKFFQKYYTSLNGYTDMYGEHIRQLGAYAPGSLTRFSELTKISDEVGIPSAKFMFVRLSGDNALIETLIQEVHVAATLNGSIALVTTLEDAIRFHSKMQWTIDSYAGT